jgi:hypothetical protein
VLTVTGLERAEFIANAIGCALIPAFIMFLCWVQWGFRWGVRLASKSLHSGRRAACRLAIATLRAHPNPLAPVFAAHWRVRLISDEARTDSAVSELEQLLSTPARRGRGPFNHVWLQALYSASLVDIWVNSGQYHAAIFAPRRFRWGVLRQTLPSACAVANINRAEALHNIGRNDLALKLLARTPRTEPIALNGGLALEAWILADEGRAQAARDLFSRIDPGPLSPYYASEVLYTRALIELTSGQREAALSSAADGLARAVRPSSERNGLFLLGRIEAALGHFEIAIAHYERARSHRYRGQSARGLFELGQLYERQHSASAARAAYAQALEEDSESAAALRCRERLAELAATSSN